MYLVDINTLDFQKLHKTDAEHCLSSAVDVYRWLHSQPKVEMPGWISVKDRLPDPKVRVLTIRMRDPDTATVDFFTGKCWTYDREWMPREAVTHWMPLPDPPEESHD